MKSPAVLCLLCRLKFSQNGFCREFSPVRSVFRVAHFPHAEKMNPLVQAADEIHKPGVGKPAVHQQVFKRDMLFNSPLNHILYEFAFGHHILSDSLCACGLLATLYGVPAPALLVCKPLRFLLVLSFLTQQALFQSKDCFAVAPAHGKGLEAEYAALGHVGEHTSDFLNAETGLWQVGVINYEDGREDGILVVCPDSDTVYHLLCGVVENLAPIGPVLRHELVKQVLFAREHTAEYGIGVMGNTFDVAERHNEKKMKYLEIGQLAVWLLVSTKHLVTYVHLLHKH